MPIKYVIYEDKKLIVAIGSGLVTAKDVISHLTHLAEDSRYISPMKKVIDYRNVDCISISFKDAVYISTLKKDLKNIFINEKCAFISPGDSTYDTSRVHQSLIENSDNNTEVFRSVDDAQKWLGIVNHGISNS